MSVYSGEVIEHRAVLPRLRARALLVALLLAAVGWVSGLPAAAHDQLVASTPGDGETLTEMPGQIMLEFNNELVPAAPALLVRDAAGTTVHRATPEVNGRVATTPFPELPDGEYRLNWSVVSSDGHRIEGSMPFALATGRSVGATPVAGEGSADPGDATGAATGAATEAGASPSSAAADGTDTAGGLADLPPAARVAIGVGALGAAVAVLGVILRARRGGIRGQ